MQIVEEIEMAKECCCAATAASFGRAIVLPSKRVYRSEKVAYLHVILCYFVLCLCVCGFVSEFVPFLLCFLPSLIIDVCFICANLCSVN